jgi:hypothetical protein
MCFGGPKQPEAPVKTPSYSADQMDQHIETTAETKPAAVKRQSPYTFDEEEEF